MLRPDTLVLLRAKHTGIACFLKSFCLPIWLPPPRANCHTGYACEAHASDFSAPAKWPPRWRKVSFAPASLTPKQVFGSDRFRRPRRVRQGNRRANRHDATSKVAELASVLVLATKPDQTTAVLARNPRALHAATSAHLHRRRRADRETGSRAARRRARDSRDAQHARAGRRVGHRLCARANPPRADDGELAQRLFLRRGRRVSGQGIVARRRHRLERQRAGLCLSVHRSA